MKLLEFHDVSPPSVKHSEEQAYVESLIKLYGDSDMTIRYDEATKTIHIGKWVTGKFHNFKSFANFVDSVMDGNNISLSKHPKYRSIGAAAILKRTP